MGIKSDVSAALIIKLEVLDKKSGKKSDRYFALTFGHGGRSLLKNNVYTYRFGLSVALKSVEKSSIRCIDKKSWDAIQSHTRTQSGKETTVDRFGIDIEQDMLKAIVGTPKVARLGSRMTGADSLSVTVNINKKLSNLASLLLSYIKQHEKKLSDEYKWIENISIVEKSSDVNIKCLNYKLRTEFNILNEIFILDNKKYSAVESKSELRLEIPEIIQWDKFERFEFGKNKHPKPDINLRNFLSTTRKVKDITWQFLKNRKVFYVYNEDNGHSKSWSVFKCIYFETFHEGSKYILNDGKWFKVDNNFVKKTDENFAKIDRLTREELGWPKYKGGGEKRYNSEVANKFLGEYVLLDGKTIRPGGGHRQIEICDLFYKDKYLIHVKKSKASSVLSHLISQGFVSGQLLQIDSDFRGKVQKELTKARKLQILLSSQRPQIAQRLRELQKLRSYSYEDLIRVDSRPKDQEFTIVYAIIKESKGDGKLSLLPFFSRVNMNNTVKILKGLGYKVKLLEINYDDKYLIADQKKIDAKKKRDAKKKIADQKKIDAKKKRDAKKKIADQKKIDAKKKRDAKKNSAAQPKK